MNTFSFVVYDHGVTKQPVLTERALSKIEYLPYGGIRLELDAIAMFEVFARTEDTRLGKKIIIDLLGDILEPERGTIISNFQLTNLVEGLILPQSCKTEDCMWALAGLQAEEIGKKVANTLEKKLSDADILQVE